MPENNILPNANYVSIAGSTFNQANTVQNYRTSETRTPAKGLGLLFERSAPSALVDSNARYDAPKCDEGTREAIIQRIMDWIESDEDWASVLWLHGSAGSGKSALARTIAELCAARKSLLATFFFTRTRNDRITDGSLLIPTLAYQLAEKMLLPRRYITKCLLQDPGIFYKAREVQMRELILKPLYTRFSLLEYHYKRLIQKTPLRLIVIDGLDECLGKDVQRDLLRVLGQAVKKLRLPVRFLIASRPEPHIRDSINEDGVLKADRLITLNLNDDPKTASDIRTFLEVQFTVIRKKHAIRSQFPSAWPSANDITTLIERASGQFIFVSTVVRYVGSSEHDPVTRLSIIIERLQPPATDAPYEQLDSLYQLIFSSAEEGKIDMDKVLQVLGILIVERPEGALDDLYNTYAGIGRVLNITQGTVLLLLHGFVSLIEVPPLESTLPIRILHASLVDFLLDSSRSGRFYVDLRRIHGLLALHYSEDSPSHISKMTSSTHRDDLKHNFLPFITHWKNADIPANDDRLCDTILLLSEAIIFLCHCLEPCEDILWSAYRELLVEDPPKSSLACDRNEQITMQRPVIITITFPPIFEGCRVLGSLDTDSNTLIYTRCIGAASPEGYLVQVVSFGGLSQTIGEGEIVLVEIPWASLDPWEVILGLARRLERKRVNLSGILFCQNSPSVSDMEWVKLNGRHHENFGHYQELCPVALVLMRGPQQGLPAASKYVWHDLQHLMAWKQAVQGCGSLLWCKHHGTRQSARQILTDVLSEHRTWGKKDRQSVDRQNAYSTLREVTIDIQAYTDLGIQFASIRNAHGMRDETWPSPEDIATLVEGASNESMYASAVVSYVGSSKHNPVKRLATLIEALPPLAADARYGQWHSLYNNIFSSAEGSLVDINKVLQVLGILIVSRPEGALGDAYSTGAGIGSVLNITSGDVILLLDEFVSVIEVPPLNSTLPIKFLHASLVDFLLDPSRSGRFWIDIRRIHGVLALYYSEHIPTRVTKMTSSTHRDDLKHHFLPFITHWKNADNDDRLCYTMSLIAEAMIFLCRCTKPCEDIIWTACREKVVIGLPTSPQAPDLNEQILKQRPVIIMISQRRTWRAFHSPRYNLLTGARNIGASGPEGSLVRAVDFGAIWKLSRESEIVVIDIALESHGHGEAVLKWLKRLENMCINFSGVLFFQDVFSDKYWIQLDAVYRQIFTHCETLCPITLVLTEGSGQPAPLGDSDVNCLTAWQRAVPVGGTLLWSKYRKTEQSAHQILWDMLSETTTWKQQRKDRQNNTASDVLKEIGTNKGPISEEAWRQALQNSKSNLVGTSASTS